MNTYPLEQILEGALLAAGEPLSLKALQQLFPEDDCPTYEALRSALDNIQASCADRAVNLVEVASGYHFIVKTDLGPWVSRLWEEKPPRYSRALLETLAIVAYRQPVTRADIEDIRGVAVSTSVMKTLLEHEWVRIVGHREVPGRPAVYATTRQFLDHFGLKHLSDLPTLAEIKALTEPVVETLAEPTEQPTEVVAEEIILVTDTEAMVPETVVAAPEDGVSAQLLDEEQIA